MASAPPARSARCRSTFAKPRSAYGRSRSRAIASSAVMRPPATASSSARSRSLSIAPPPLQEQVRRAGLETREVDGDVDVAQLAEASDDRLVPPVLPQPCHLVAADLQSRQPVVVAHAELAEAERPHEGLGGVDLAQLLRGDAIAVLEARRQARERGLVPGRQPERAREIADLLLGQAGLDHRGADAALPGRLHARPVVAEVVHVRAVHEGPARLALGDRRQVREQLLLAEEAPVGAVLRVLGIGQLVRAHHDVTQADEGGEPPRLRQLALRIRLGVRGDEHRADSETYPEGELAEARRLAALIGLRHVVVRTDELANPEYAKNGANRCFFCKEELFTHLAPIAEREGCRALVYGANVDDLGDHRPGMQSAKQRGVRAPMIDAGLTKQEIRDLSHALGLPTWDKPSFACLSSRFQYGDPITAEKLRC